MWLTDIAVLKKKTDRRDTARNGPNGVAISKILVAPPWWSKSTISALLIRGFNPSEKYESVKKSIPYIWENKNVPNHQPASCGHLGHSNPHPNFTQPSNQSSFPQRPHPSLPCWAPFPEARPLMLHGWLLRRGCLWETYVYGKTKATCIDLYPVANIQK